MSVMLLHCQCDQDVDNLREEEEEGKIGGREEGTRDKKRVQVEGQKSTS